jgi:hypothetical protein
MNEEKIKEILEENAKLKEELQATKEHLKKYTAPASRKVYYENNKDKEKQRAKEYKEKTNYKSTPEQIQKYNKQSYLRRKEKLQTEMEEKQKGGNI